MTETLERDLRRKIYDIVQKNPGLHLSKIAEILNVRISSADYNLRYLEKKRFIVSTKDESGYHRRYYGVESGIGAEDKKIVALLRQEMILKIIIHLIKKKRMRHRDLLQVLDISSSTLSYYITKLVDHKIIEISTYGEEKGYTIRDMKQITKLLLIYPFYRIPDNLEDTWSDFTYLPPKKSQYFITKNRFNYTGEQGQTFR